MLVTELTPIKRRQLPGQPPVLVTGLTPIRKGQQFACFMPGLLQPSSSGTKSTITNTGRICASKRGKYALAEPKSVAKEFYVKELQQLLLKDDEARVQLVKPTRGSTRVQRSNCLQ